MAEMEKKLRQGDPVSNNVHNLVQTLSVKLDSVARYKLYIEDAQHEGEQECVDLFRRLEEQDRRAVDELRQHLSSRIGLREEKAQRRAA
jgi:rubrerythrin